MAVVIPRGKSTGKKTREEDVQSRINNIQTRLDSVGEVDIDSRNWFEKSTNLPEKQNALFDILDLIQRPSQVITNMVGAKASDKDTRSMSEAALDGISGRKKMSYSDVLEDLGVENKFVKHGAGFALDVVLDPTTYIPAAAIAKVAKAGGKGLKAVTPAPVQQGLGTVKKGIGEMFGGRFAGLDDIDKQMGKDIDASQRYLTDKAMKETVDLHTEFGGRSVDTSLASSPKSKLDFTPESIAGSLDMGQAVGRRQELDLKITKDAATLVDDIIKGRNPRFNMLEENSVNVVNAVNKSLRESPVVIDKVKALLGKVNQIKVTIAKINDKHDIKALMEKKKILNDAEQLKNAGKIDELVAREYGVVDDLTEQELKVIARVEKLNNNIQKYTDLIKGIGRGVQIKPVAAGGKGLVIDNPYKRLFSKAGVKTDDIIDDVSPQRGIDEFIPDDNIPVSKSDKFEYKVDREGDRYQLTTSDDLSSVTGYVEGDELYITTAFTHPSVRRQGRYDFLLGKMAKQALEENPNIKKVSGTVVGEEALNARKRYPSTKINKDAHSEGYDAITDIGDILPKDKVTMSKGKAAVNTLITTGKLTIPNNDAMASTLKAMFKDDISLVSKKNTTVTLKNPEKYKDLDVNDITFSDRIKEIHIPRPERVMSQNMDVSLVAKKLADGNQEIRDTIERFGLKIGNVEGYMTHILAEELAKNKSKSGKAMIGGNKAVTKSRTYDGSAEDINELLGESKFDTDAFFSSAIGRKKLIEYAHAEAFKNNLLGRHGKILKDDTILGADEAIIRPADFNFFKTEGGALAVSKAESYVVPKAVASALHNWQRTINDEGINKFLKGYDAIHNTWKKFALFSAGFHVRNDIGNTFNMWVSGMPMVSVLKYKARAIADVSQIREIQKLNNIGRELTPAQHKLFDDYDNFARQGLKEGSVFENELKYKGGEHKTVKKAFDYANKSTAGKGVSKALSPFKTSRDIGTSVDEVSRYALYKWAKDKGMSSQKAANKVREVLFDYSDLSNLEQGIKRVVPFYTWMRNNIPFQLKNLMLQPAKYTAVEKARQTALDVTEINDEELPEWYKEAFAMPVLGDGEGNGKIANLNLPLSDLTKMSNVGKMGVDVLTPLIKTPIELFTNNDFFKGKNISSFEGETEKLFGLDVNKKLVHAIKQLGAVRNLAGYADKAIEGDAKAVLKSFLTGNIIKDQNAEDARYYNMLDQLTELDDAAKRYKQKSEKALPTVNELKKSDGR